MLRYGSLLLSSLIVLLIGPISSVSAHPHVWVTVQTEIVMDGTKVKEVRHHWAFDEAFSAFASQGLDDNGDGVLSREELQPLAQVNVESLSEFDYFSDIYEQGAGERDAGIFDEPRDYWLSIVGNELVLHFTLPVLAKVDTSKEVVLDVYDPTFFVDFAFAEKAPAKLVQADAGCALSLKKAEDLDGDTMGLLAQIPADQRELPEDLLKMTETMANQVILTCK